MTKPVAAGAAMILVEEWRLRLDDPVVDLLPKLSDMNVVRSLEGPVDDTVLVPHQGLGCGHLRGRVESAIQIYWSSRGEVGGTHQPQAS